MGKSRIFAHESYAALRSAAKLTIADCGGLEAAAEDTRVGKSVLAGYYAPGGEAFMPADVAADLEYIGGRPRVTGVLARLAGFDLVPKMPLGEGMLPSALAELGQRVAQTLGHAAVALADGAIDERERAQLLADLAELQQATHHVEAALSPRLPLGLSAAKAASHAR